LSTEKDALTTPSDRRPAFRALNAEIQLRHYSPKTLKAYTGWAGPLQYFTRSKNPLLSSSGVKDFLTFPAVLILSHKKGGLDVLLP
jgi:hypothetical protein